MYKVVILDYNNLNSSSVPDSKDQNQYKNFKVRVKWDGKYVMGLTKVSSLKRITEVVEHREGGDSSIVRKSKGKTTFESIKLERGITHDLEFEKWANEVWNYNSIGSTEEMRDYRKDVVIEICDEQEKVIARYTIYRCWISEYQALPDFDANSNAVVIENIILQNEGWERDELPVESNKAN